MSSMLYALVTLLGWGTWLAPSQKVPYPNQQVKTLYVAAANAVIATAVALARGSISELNAFTFWLTFTGGLIWALGGLSAFTGTSKLGMAKAFGIWAPLNIVVSLIWGAVLFDEFVHLRGSTVVLFFTALTIIVAGVLLIIFARGGEAGSSNQGAFRIGLAGAVGAGILWGSYFIPVKYSGVSAWAGAFPQALAMSAGSVLLALLARQSWRLRSAGDTLRTLLTGGLWSLGNYGMLLLVGAIGAGKGFTIAQLSVVVSALIGILWLREPAPKTRAAWLTLAGCVLATAGGVVLGNLK